MIDLICVGKPRGPLAEASSLYERRLQRYCRLRVIEVREEPLQRGTAAEVMTREAGRLAPHLQGQWVIALDRAGRQLDSEALAGLVREREEQPPQHTAFVIGGACGLDPSLLAAARLRLGLGAGTLPHQLARVVLVEQLYRAFTILRGEPYHR